MLFRGIRPGNTRVLGVLGLCAAIGLLMGCSAPSSAPTGTGTTVPTSKSTVSSALPSDLLFVVTANVRSDTGSTIGIQLIAHKPVAYDNRAAKALAAEYTKGCVVSSNGLPASDASLAGKGSILVPIDLVSTVTGKKFAAPITLSLGSPFFGQSAKGTGIAPVDPKLPCFNGYTWSTSGSGHAVAEFDNTVPTPDLTDFKNGYYGFLLPEGSTATIEACTVNLTAAATTAVAGTVGWDPTDPGGATSCGIGYSGN